MKKTVLTNISGMPFYLEEDAYQKLDNYINEIKKYFTNTEGYEEIVSDIENRIAEKFTTHKSEQKQVITLPEVEEIIQSLGTIADFDFEAEGGKSKKENNNTEPRRLMRDPDNTVLGGVSSGIAAYFGIDVTIIRAIFITLTIFGGPGLIVYIILWIAMPEAKSRIDKMQMRGEPLTLANIEEKVRKNIDGNNSQKESWLTKLILLPFRLVTATIKGIGKALPAAISGLGVLVSVFACLILFILTAGVGMLVFLHDSPNYDVAFPNFPGSLNEYIAVITMYLAVAIPTFFIILLGVSLIKKKYILSTLSTIVLLIIWITTTSIAGVLAADIVPGLQKEYEASKVTRTMENITPFTKVLAENGANIHIKKGEQTEVKITGVERYLNDITAQTENGELKIVYKSHPKACLFCFRALSLEIITPVMEEVTFTDAAHGNIEGFEDLERFKVNLEGAASLILTGSSETFTATVADASRLNADEFEANNVEISVSEASSAEVNAVETLKINAEDASRVYYRGEATVESNIEGASTVRSKGE